MANRKVLINRHTSTSGAPIASEMFKGEIAVAHKTGEEILWTKNNDNEMVPFISCAQTMTMINNAISDADVTYDVKAANGDAHVEVVSGGTEKAKVFTVSSKDVQSKEAFDAYSADTKQRIDKNASAITETLGIVSALTDIVVTEIKGDDIITATILSGNTGSNAYNLTHKKALATDGFNKLATDAYGHVTASTAVVAADIKSLGFEDSAWTEEKIASAITALDSSARTTDNKHYLTGIDIVDGKITGKTEEALPTLSVESAGTGNVVSEITVDDHKITYQTVSVATSEDIQALSSATIAFSAATVSGFSSAFTVINELSAGTISVFASAKTYTDEKIQALDSETAVTAGKYLTGIAIADGKISGITEADLPKLSSASTGDGNVVTDIQVNDHAITFVKGLTVASQADLNALSSATESFSSAIHSMLGELSGYTEDVDNKVKNLSAATLDLSAVTLTGVTMNGTPLTVTDHVASFNETQLTKGAATGTGNVITDFTVTDHEITATKGITALESVIAEGDDYLDASVAGNSAITVATKEAVVKDKDTLAGVTASGSLVDAKAVKEYVQDIVSSGVNYRGATGATPEEAAKGDLYIADAQFTAGTQTVEVGDFIIYNGESWDVIEKNDTGAITGNLTANTVTLGNGEHTVKSLANGSNGTVLAMVEGVPAWTSDVKVNSAITADSALTSESALTAVHADAASKVDSALTIHILTSANTTASTHTFDGSQNVVVDIPGSTDTATTEEGHYVPATAASAFTAPAGSFLSGVSVDSKNHVLAVAYADKINSASTAESADTASKVNNALSVSGYSDSSAATLNTAFAYDGSEGKSLTFGTNGPAGLKSMSMTSAGLVDVEVIDCGEY